MTQVEKRKMWESQVAAFQASGQSVSAWCATHDVKENQLYYWISKFKSEDSLGVKQTQWLSMEQGEWNANPQPQGLNIRVGKVTIEVGPGFDALLLSDVIRTLAVL